MNNTIGWCVFSVVILITCLSSATNDHQRETEYYCEMVESYKQSDGENGWPDYKEQYDELCTPLERSKSDR